MSIRFGTSRIKLFELPISVVFILGVISLAANMNEVFAYKPLQWCKKMMASAIGGHKSVNR